MKAYYIGGSKITPIVKLKEGELFSITGDSRPEDVSEFYSPIIEWFSELKERSEKTSENRKFSILFFMEYLNSSSVIFLSKVLKKITEISELENVTFNVEWQYLEYDEDMKELGEEFKTIYTNLNVKLKSV